MNGAATEGPDTEPKPSPGFTPAGDLGDFVGARFIAPSRLLLLEPVFWAAWQIGVAVATRFWVPLLFAGYAVRLAAELRRGGADVRQRVRNRLTVMLLFYFLFGLVPAWAGKIARPPSLSPWLLEAGFAVALALHLVIRPRRSDPPATAGDTSPS